MSGWNYFFETDPTKKVTPVDSATAGGLCAKSMSVLKGQETVIPTDADTGDGQQSSQEQVATMAENDIEAWNEFMEDLNSKIFEVQMQQDLTAKKDELDKEFQKIVTMVKEGKLGVVEYWIAMAKYNCQLNGTMLAQMGTKIVNYNDEMAKIQERLLSKPITNEQEFYAATQMAQSEMRNLQTNQQFLQSDMQKVFTNIESTFQAVDGFMKTLDEELRNIIFNLKASPN